MIFRALALLGLLAACAATETNTVSAMNYLQEPVVPSCARDAVLAEDGFAIRGKPRLRGGAAEFTALFNDDLPVRVIVREQRDGTAEVSAFARLGRDATPLDEREARFAVGAADEAIYRSCTKDGRIYGGDVVIEAR